MKLNILLLTCANNKEADKITKILLKKRLIACSKQLSVSASFLWKEKINKSNEILLIMDSIEEYFEKINAEIKKLHSYETYVLTSVHVSKTTKDVENWIKTQLK